VTSSEKPGRNGRDAEPEAERTTVLATAGEDVQAEPPAGPAPSAPSVPSAQERGNGEVTDDLELSHSHTVPPPWQRVSTDTSYGQARPPVDEPTIDSSHHVGPPSGPIPERPVVTGTAAPRVFNEAPLGGPAYPGPPPRTTVHLEGANSSNSGNTGPIRAVGAAPPNVLRRPGRGPRRANLQVKRFDPWSVLKLSLVLGVALFFVWLVAVGALYAVLDGMGVWDKVNGISTDLLQGNEGNSQPLISAGRVFGIAAIVGAINIVLFSALATVGAFVYNVSADLAGGLEVTLAERE
jgi:hypothetical protein